MWRTPTALILAGLLYVAPAAADDAKALAALIDDEIDSRLDAARIARVPEADDAEFLRRVFLDLHGVVPSAARAAKFLESKNRHKRGELIDELLGDPRFGEHLADQWRRRLISPLAGEQRLQTERFADWLAGRFNSGDGWDQIVRELLTASGKIEDNPAVVYLIEGRNPLSVTDLTDLSSRYFLGVRLNCAQCHDHPFVEWKRQDYWGMAAFFAQMQTPGRPKQVYQVGVRDDAKLSLAVLRDADTLEGFLLRPPTFLGGQVMPEDAAPTHRAALAAWITSPENPYFARAAVNRAWWHLFGRGIVNPVDDMHAGNSASHPTLLDEMSKRFVASGFDLKSLYRAIAGSRTYQRTSRPAERPEQEAELFGRMSIKVLSAEQLYDSLVEILGPPQKTPGIDARFGTRQEFAQFFADGGDAEPTRYDRGIPHVLRLMNSPQFAGRGVTALASRVAAPGRSADEAVEELFQTILARHATDAERGLVRDELREPDATLPDACRKLAWALLMSSEFSLNH